MHLRLHRDRTGAKNPLDITHASRFVSPAAAFSFIVKWDGESVVPLLEAIQKVRAEGGQVMQEYLRRAVSDLSRRIPMPSDIPSYVASPILAADRNGKILLGREGDEQIVEISSLRQDIQKLPSLTAK